jgi:hypothetical protein
MKQVAVKDQRISGVKIAIDKLHCFEGVVDKGQIGSNLFAGKSVIHSSELMRSFDHLEATVLLIGFCKSNHNTDQLIGEHELILVPVPIVLVPFPCATNTWFFLHEFRVKMANGGIAIEQWSYRADHPLTSCHVSKDVVARREPQ